MNVNLEPIAANLERLLQGRRELEARLDRIEERTGELESRDSELGDETTVLADTALCSSSEHTARGGVQSRPERPEERIGRLERTRPGAP